MNDDLAKIYSDAIRNGLDDDGAKAAVAIAKAEGGLKGAVGDPQLGGSYGAYQFLWDQGMLPGFAKAIGATQEYAANLLKQNPHAGNDFALGGYLGQAIRNGQANGYSGAQLALVAGKNGQRPQAGNERSYFNAWNSLFGGGQNQIIPNLDPTGMLPQVQLPQVKLPEITVPGGETLRTVAETIAQIPAGITKPITDQVTQMFSFLEWIGQTNLYLRGGLLLLGAILLLIGLVLLALSFVDVEKVAKAAPMVA